MKKVFCILLTTLLLVTLFAGCGNQANTQTTEGTTMDEIKQPMNNPQVKI